MINEIKKNGVIFTPDDLADFMSQKIVQNLTKRTDEELIIIEPSAGDGALAESIVKNVQAAGYNKIVLYAFDINEKYLSDLKNNIGSKFPGVTIKCVCSDFIDFAYSNTELKADIIISNPPYVRTQNMDKKYIDFANEKLNLGGRIDLYHIFICLLQNVIKGDGIISIVVSNKFISNKAGATLREFIINNYTLYGLYDFGDTKLFNASVLPAVMTMSLGKTENQNAEYISMYSCKEKTNEPYLFEAMKAKMKYASIHDETFEISYGLLNIEANNWTLFSDENMEFLDIVSKNTIYNFSDFAKIKVGIKTTADKIFISDDWERFGDAKPELLRTLITHRVGGQFFSQKSDSYKVLYPYISKEGKKFLVDLEQYPNTKKYFLDNYETLAGRKYIQESSKEWFEIWVPHSPVKWEKSTIVFRDISEHPMFWKSEAGSVVNGDCYWFDFNNNITEDIFYLILGIANSTFIEKYYDLKFNNKLYSGRRRFMTQYVEKFPIFSENTDEAIQIIEILKKASKSNSISEKEIETINNLVYDGFTQKN